MVRYNVSSSSNARFGGLVKFCVFGSYGSLFAWTFPLGLIAYYLGNRAAAKAGERFLDPASLFLAFFLLPSQTTSSIFSDSSVFIFPFNLANLYF